MSVATFTATAIILVAFIIIAIIYRHAPSKRTPPPIYAIMITGKDACRVEFARASVSNFQEQDYGGEKRLIIINHGRERVTDTDMTAIDTTLNIFEFHVAKDKHSLALGDLRNIALELVPIDALWTVWDDDDYRSPQYMSTLQKHMHKTRADAVVFTSRTEYNHNTGLVWKMKLKSGFVTVLAKQDKRIKYQSKDSMEDSDLVSTLRRLKKVATLDTDSTLDSAYDFYIRTVHTGNTSLYVDQAKQNTNNSSRTNINYIESEIDPGQQVIIRDFMYGYFKRAFQCIDESVKT